LSVIILVLYGPEDLFVAKVAELKQKASKAKDATVTSVKNTKDRHTSVPLNNTNWNPYDGTGPRPPPPPRVNANSKPKPQSTFLPPPVRGGSASPQLPSSSPSPTPPLPGRSGPPVINRSSRPPGPSGVSPKPSLKPSPALPTRTPSATPSLPARTPSATPSLPARTPPLPSRASSYQQPQQIDWTNLSPEDKQVFFNWLDEFFTKSYGITPS